MVPFDAKVNEGPRLTHMDAKEFTFSRRDEMSIVQTSLPRSKFWCCAIILDSLY